MAIIKFLKDRGIDKDQIQKQAQETLDSAVELARSVDVSEFLKEKHIDPEHLQQQTLAAYDKSVEMARSVVPKAPDTLYGETAEACERISDTIQQIPDGRTQLATKVIASKLGMAGTSGALLGLASTIGTASTGTAIGTLSGAAFTSASAAWLGGSVAMGTALLGVAGVAGGVGVAFGAGWMLKKKWDGEQRHREELTDREQRIIEVCTALGGACRQLENKGNEITPSAAKAVYEETLKPLLIALEEEREQYETWQRGPRFRVRRAYRNIKKVAEKVRHIASLSPTLTISAFAVGIASVLQGDVLNLPEDQELVLEALRRSTNALSDASPEEVSDYLCSMSPEQMDGVINNVKGIYHELLFVEAENCDGDIYEAALFGATNHPGADVLITNTVTGEIEEVQLKATDYLSYIQERKDRYQDFEVYATSEVAFDDPDIEWSGFSNEEITTDTEDTLTSLTEGANSTVDDAMIIAGLVSVAMQCGRVLKGERFDSETTKDSIKEIAKASFMAGMVSWVIS